MSLHHAGAGRRTLGYKYQEHILPIDRHLTVVGQASNQQGTLMIGRGGAAFIVSLRSRAEMLGSAKKRADLTAALSGVCALVGVGLTIAGLLSG